MKKTLFSLIAALFVAVAFSQTSTTPTVLRTLGLPPEYGIIDGYISDYKISRKLVITKTVDNSKSVKVTSPTGRVTYQNAPTTWGYEITQTRDELTNSGTYLPNLISMKFGSPAVYINPNDVFEIKKDRINPTSSGGWIGYETNKIQELQPGLVVISTINELGSDKNVIPRVFVKRVNGVNHYKNPVDYLGRPIVGDTIFNNGVPSTSMRVNYNNRVVSVSQVTKTLQGSGSWSTNNPVWSGGVKTYTTTASVYVPVADLPSLFAYSIDELTQEMRTETYCTVISQNPPRITSTSTEIIVNGNQYKGVTYYNGIDASISRPTGQITSYGKSYPGHVQRWFLKQWNQDGTVATGSGSYGQVLTVQFASGDDSTINLVAGNSNSYNSVTKTLTYDASKLNELWYTFEELPAQGKNWTGETIIKL